MKTHNDFFPRPISIFLLVLAATIFASNHIGARFAFDNGTGLFVAVLARSAMALCFMLAIVKIRRASIFIPKEQRKWQLLIGVLITGQSLSLYKAITLIPIPMALLIVNTWPMMFILAHWATGKRTPSLKIFLYLMLILFGLVFALDIQSHSEAEDGWYLGVFLAGLSAVLLAGIMWLTQYQLAGLPGSVRSSYTMLTAVILMIAAGAFDWLPGGGSLPENATGWLGLLSLAIAYGIAITLLFVLTPKLDMARNSPMLNFEPVASLFLSYAFLGQILNSSQLIGGALVLSGIIAIGFSRQ